MPTAIVIRESNPSPSGEVWYPLAAQAQPASSPQPKQVVVRFAAAALNHRDVFIRQHQYPGTAFAVPLLADGAGVVTAAGADEDARRWLGRRVVINPARGWRADRDGPEPDAGGFAILGGTKYYAAGTLADEAVFDAAEVHDAPAHLTDAQAAALPLAGLTAWRALVTKSGAAQRGCNLLVTGIGGGVALMVLLLAVRMGVSVWVTSGSADKIERAKGLGARGGVSYKEQWWEKKLLGMLPKERPMFDAVIDGAGGEIVNKATRLLKQGGVIVSYGMTLGPVMPFSMGTVLRNIEVRGSTMGSRREFRDMLDFVAEHKVVPVVSRTVQGLDLKEIDGLFEDMKNGSQFGKLVVEIQSVPVGSKM